MRSTICLVLLGWNLLAAQAFATGLVNYRHLGKKGESSKKSSELALERVKRLTGLLGTEGTAALVSGDNTPLARLGASGMSNRYKLSASNVIKALMREAVEELADLEKYGKPSTFHPASINNEGEGKNKRREKRCTEFLNRDIPQLKTTYFGQLTREYGAIFSQQDVPLNQPEYPKLDELRNYLNNFISRYQPRGGDGINNVMGSLSNVGFTDGVISHLYFDKGATVSLSSLITYRTGEDELFLALLGCFRNRIATALETNEHQNIRRLMERVKPRLEERVKRALNIHGQYSKLNKAQLNFLIHVLLHVRGYDVPAEEEFAVGDGKVFPQYSLVEYFSNYQPRHPRAGIPDRTMDDYIFYKGLNVALRELEDHLIEEEALEKQTEGIINNLRAMGNK